VEHVPPSAVSSWKLVMALVFFSLTYLVIITEFRNRAVAALAGATGIVLTGVLPLEDALTRYIEWKTIALLVGMMIIVGITIKTGLFPYLAVRAASGQRATPCAFSWPCPR